MGEVVPGFKTRINRRSISALQRGDWLTDDSLPGFKARRPNRLALYGLNIRLNGRMRWLSIGTESDFSPDQARAEAERLRGLKRQGENPALDRDRLKKGLTFGDAADKFLASHVRRKLRPTTAAHYAETIQRLILPEFGSWRLEAITPADVSSWHERHHETPTQANRALAITSSIFGWANRTNMFAGLNPCAKITRYRETAINKYPTVAEVQAILGAADDLAEEGEVSLYFAAGLKVLALSGARRSEVFNARRDWIDRSRGDLVLPDSKTGAKRVSLPVEVLVMLDNLPAFGDSPFLFPSFTGAPFVNFPFAWKQVLKRAAVGHWRIHDMRHAFASAAVEGGAPLYTVGKILGHLRPITTQRYAHLADEPRRAVVSTVAQQMTRTPDEVQKP